MTIDPKLREQVDAAVEVARQRPDIKPWVTAGMLVGQVLNDHESWSADTLDQIAAVFHDLGLATSASGFFELNESKLRQVNQWVKS
jgi:hypothetical protein